MFSTTAVWLGTVGGIYNVQHDSVLSAITKTSMTADISNTYKFPHHIIPIDLRPDWDNANHPGGIDCELRDQLRRGSSEEDSKVPSPCGAGQG